MASEDDEFDSYDFAEFTADELALVDESIMANSNVTANANRGGPAITVEVEQSANNISHNDQLTRGLSSNATVLLSTRQRQASPFQQFRSWNKVLSVSDLVSPAWCELQFDYGLRQKRNRKPESRPASFTSAKGKVISVEKKVAAKNDRKLQRGRSVHKILEKEIRPEEVHIPVSFDEERWALRLVNMLSGIQILMTLGCTREMPVFGIVRGQIVVGVIDELLRKPVPVPVPDVDVGPSNCAKRTSESSHATPKSKRTRRSPSPSQPDTTPFPLTSPGLVSSPDDRPSTPPHLASELVPTPTPTLQAPLPSHKFTLHLLDTKSRYIHSLPDDVDTTSSRLQLMLYHRLLSSLIFPDSVDQLNFRAFWARLGMNPTAKFSTSFKNQAGVLLLGNNIKFNCLDDLTRLLREQVRDLDVPSVDERLQLIYRTQPKGIRKGNGNGKGKGKSKFTDKAIDILLSQEDLDIARAIEESLKSTTGEPVGVAEHKFAMEVAKSLKQSQSCVAGPSDEGSRDLGILTSLGEGNGLPDDLVDNPELQWVLQESLLDQAKQAYGLETTDEESSEPTSPVLGVGEEVIITPPSENSIIIGTKEFSLDDRFLDGHLTDVLQWWHGQRAPKGVEVALSRRCFTCEYRNGCEWREMKTNEAAMALKKRQAFKGGQ